MVGQSTKPRSCGPNRAVTGFAFALAVGLCGLLVAQPASALVTATGDVEPADPETWTDTTTADVGKTAAGAVSITDGSVVYSEYANIGYGSSWTADVTVDGPGSLWVNSEALRVGHSGRGTLSVTHGGTVLNWLGIIGAESGSLGEVTVDTAGSAWETSVLFIGWSGAGTLSITHGGMVTVFTEIHIDYAAEGNSFINMSTGGMLAVKGDGDDSLEAFLQCIEGKDAIRYWDDEIADWANIKAATLGEDYTLQYIATGDLAGYTVLTVGTNASSTPGDANHDGWVDATDAAALAARWLQQGGWADGDFNADGWVNDLDLAILAANWQPGPSSPAVPEPGTVALVVSALLAIGALAVRRCGKA